MVRAKKLTFKQSDNNLSVVSTLPYIAHLIHGEFSLQEYHHGTLWTNCRLLKGPSGIANNMKLFTAPICNINRLFHLFSQPYRKVLPGSFPEGALVYLLQGFYHMSQQRGIWCVHSQAYIDAIFYKIQYEHSSLLYHLFPASEGW